MYHVYPEQRLSQVELSVTLVVAVNKGHDQEQLCPCHQVPAGCGNRTSLGMEWGGDISPDDARPGATF